MRLDWPRVNRKRFLREPRWRWLNRNWLTCSRYTPNGRSPNLPSSTTKKPRRRVATVSQRRAANIRERRRMFNLNEAFDKLRRKVMKRRSVEMKIEIRNGFFSKNWRFEFQGMFRKKCQRIRSLGETFLYLFLRRARMISLRWFCAINPRSLCSGTNVCLREAAVENRNAALGDHVYRLHGRTPRHWTEQSEARVYTTRILPAKLSLIMIIVSVSVSVSARIIKEFAEMTRVCRLMSYRNDGTSSPRNQSSIIC